LGAIGGQNMGFGQRWRSRIFCSVDEMTFRKFPKSRFLLNLATTSCESMPLKGFRYGFFEVFRLGVICPKNL